MSLSTATMRGINRLLAGNKLGVGVQRIVTWPETTTPVYGNHARPTSAPSGTAAKGDWYVGTDGQFYLHDGTAFRAYANAGTAAQTVGGALTVAGAATLQSTLAVTGAATISGQLASLRQVKTGATTLTAAMSGALCIFNTAAGYTFTLPTAAAGIWFDFVIQTTITSVGAKVLTASASEFLVGVFTQGSDGTYVPVYRAADGTTHRSWNGNGSTTGGFAGDWFRLTAISSTQWNIFGFGQANGTEATPFATS